MRHDTRVRRAGLTVVEIILLIALIILPLTLVLILFGRDIKAYVSRNWGSAKSESKALYAGGAGGPGIGAQGGDVGAAGEAPGGDASAPKDSGAPHASASAGGSADEEERERSRRRANAGRPGAAGGGSAGRPDHGGGGTSSDLDSGSTPPIIAGLAVLLALVGAAIVSGRKKA